ncbi:helix-turn-helix domain-containing protein [Actinomadura sp. 3N407]|uniref:helix-turn-helix domain-containing protein n=1 Tax=Actinomadura sp. 3N407 TaxID=3457423 RepID=UPI003FCDFEBB
MARQVKRAFRYRFYPTDEQAAESSRTFGCVRLVYNKATRRRSMYQARVRSSKDHVTARAAGSARSCAPTPSRGWTRSRRSWVAGPSAGACL